MSLSPKQQRFVDEYCVDQNATQAALRAGYSEKTAYSQGQRLLKKVEIAAAIAERQGQHAERCNVTVDTLTAELDEARELARKEGQPGAFVQAVMGKAKLCGFAKDQPIKFDLPPVENADQVTAAQARVIDGAASGEITLSEAESLAKLLEGQRRTIELAELDKRISELEAEKDRT